MPRQVESDNSLEVDALNLPTKHAKIQVAWGGTLVRNAFSAVLSTEGRVVGPCLGASKT